MDCGRVQQEGLGGSLWGGVSWAATGWILFGELLVTVQIGNRRQLPSKGQHCAAVMSV